VLRSQLPIRLTLSRCMALSAEFLAEDAAAAETVILWPLVGPVAGVVDEDKQPLRRDFQLFIGPLHCITFGPPIGPLSNTCAKVGWFP
jgi:hypothetical protein